MTPLGIGQFCLGNDSDSLSEWFPGKIFIDECFLIQQNPNAKQPMGKYKLKFINEPRIADVQLDEVTATVSTSTKAASRQMTASVTATNPSGALIQKSTTSATSGYNTGSTSVSQSQAVTFDAGKTQTKNVWFKISKSGYQTTTYKVAMKQTATATTTSSWSDWSYWSNGVSRDQAAAAMAYLQNTYGSDIQVQVFQGTVNGSTGWHVRYKKRTYSTSYSYSYSKTITKLET